MPRNRVARDHLADGLHYRGEEQPSDLLCCRTGMDPRQRRPYVDMRESVRAERCRHRVLRVVRIPRADDLLDRSRTKRVSWSAENAKTGLLFVSSIVVVFYTFCLAPTLLAVGLGSVALVIGGAYSVVRLLGLVRQDRFPGPFTDCYGDSAADTWAKGSQDALSMRIEYPTAEESRAHPSQPKPKLLFIRSTTTDRASFIRKHLDEHVKCLSLFFDVALITSEDCDYKQLCETYRPDLALFESGTYVSLDKRRNIRNTDAFPEVPRLGLCNADAYCRD